MINKKEDLYIKFLETEKIHSKIFFDHFKIENEKRFEEEDYLFIKKILNEKLCEKIINIIKKIISEINKEKLDSKVDIINLILGDFLFSLISNDLNNPFELFFKFNRDDYIQRIRLRALINEKFGINYYEYIKLHKKLLLGLRGEGCTNRIIIKTKKENWNTFIYFQLNFEQNLSEKTLPKGVSKKPFLIRNIFDTNYAISNFRNIWKIKRKKREMVDFPISKEGIIAANNIEWALSMQLYELNKKHIIDKKNELLSECNCKSLEEYYEKIKKNSEDKKWLIKLHLLKENKKELNLLKWDNMHEYANIIKNFQKIVSFNLINEKNLDVGIYLPCFMDNRGRQYYGTLLSPTFYKLFRNLYKFNIKKDYNKLEESIFYNKIIKYSYLINEYNLSIENNYKAIILFIEIGKFFIKTNENCFIKTEDFIINGIKNYKEKNINLKFEDKLYIEKIYLNLDHLLNNREIDDNMIIFKDATASGIQNYGIILGYKEEMLKYINLDDNDWCDTYQYIIQKFLEEKLKKIFEKSSIEKKIKSIIYNRDIWKNTIMTIPYNAVWFSCFKKFIINLRKNGLEYNDLKEEDKKKIKKLHKEFYTEVKNNIKEEFFKKKNNEKMMENFEYVEWKIVTITEYKVNFNKLRDKYRDIVYMLINDKKTTLRALEANNMHYLDVKLVIYLIKHFEILTIHDCFGIRLCELHLMMDKINEYYSNKIGKKCYSIHVIK